MSKTAVSELNARMSLDIAPLERAVPRASALLKRLGGAVQAEAFTAQNMGPDLKALSENLRARIKNAPDMPQFGDTEEQQALADQIAARKEETMRREAVAIRARQQLQDQLAEEGRARSAEEAAEAERRIADIDRIRFAVAQLTEAETRRVASGSRNAAQESASVFGNKTQAAIDAEQAVAAAAVQSWAARRQAAMDYFAQESQAMDASKSLLAGMLRDEEMLADRRAASARAQIEFADMQRDVIAKNARESFAVFDAEARKAEERLATEQKIADVRRKQAQVQTTARFDLANPFEKQVLAVKELNRLLAVRRSLQRGTVQFAEAELAVTRQIAQVRSIRSELTVGTEAMRRAGTTAADSQKGFARFGLGMQQAGYQVQDFAVQVASGTNALVALSQQGSQLLGFFGGFKGAIAGAALSVGILAYRLYDSKRGAEAAKKAQEEYNEKLKEFHRLARESAKLKDPEAAKRFNVQDARQALAEVQKQKDVVAGIESQLVSLRQQWRDLVPEMRFLGPEEQKGLNAAFEARVKKLTEQAEAARKELFGKSVAAKGAALVVEEDNKRAADEQAEAFRNAAEAAAEYEARLGEARRRNDQFGESLFDKRRRLMVELMQLEDSGPQDPLRAQELGLELKETWAQITATADKYKDQLDPLREQKRTIEEINRLQGLGLLEAGEAALLQTRIADERERQLKLPDVMRQQTGSSYAGLSNTGTAQQHIDLVHRQVDLLQQQLAALRSLVFQGAN